MLRKQGQGVCRCGRDKAEKKSNLFDKCAEKQFSMDKLQVQFGVNTGRGVVADCHRLKDDAMQRKYMFIKKCYDGDR